MRSVRRPLRRRRRDVFQPLVLLLLLLLPLVGLATLVAFARRCRAVQLDAIRARFAADVAATVGLAAGRADVGGGGA